MWITRAPFRISLFGGSTDYKEFYSQHGSLLVGTTINKYFYTSFRFRPPILDRHSIISYSKLETVSNNLSIEHPVVREALRKYHIHSGVDIHLIADISSRTGLGGSSAFCVSLLYLLEQLTNDKVDKKYIGRLAIYFERELLRESGGIQDQIWATYGGFNSIEIEKDGGFYVKPMPLSHDFKEYLNQSMVLVFTEENKRTNDVAISHEHKDKINIKQLAHEGYRALVGEYSEDVGRLLLESWEEKKKISPLISTPKIDEIAQAMMDLGCYGVKLLGSGGGGFLLGIGDPISIGRCKTTFKGKILDFKFENEGVNNVFNSRNQNYVR